MRFFLDIELTNICNASCLICPRSKLIRPKGKMARETFEEIADKISLAKHFTEGIVAFCGFGEPLLHPDIFDFLKVLKKIPKKIEATLVTNGYRLSRRVTDKLIACGLDRIYISIQAADEGLYRTLMPGLKLNVVVNNVRYLVRCAPPDLRAIVTTTLHELNREHKEKLACLTASLGIRGFSVNNIHTRGGNLDDPRFIKKRVLNRAKRCRIFEEVNFISWDGRILPCCHDLEGITVADITRNSFNDIAAIKRDVVKKGRKYAFCAYCNDEHRIRLFREYENSKSYVDI